METLFTDREADLMQVLWDHGVCSAAQAARLRALLDEHDRAAGADGAQQQEQEQEQHQQKQQQQEQEQHQQQQQQQQQQQKPKAQPLVPNGSPAPPWLVAC